MVCKVSGEGKGAVQKLECVKGRGRALTAPLDTGLLGFAARAGELTNVTDMQLHPLFTQETDIQDCPPDVEGGMCLGEAEVVMGRNV